MAWSGLSHGAICVGVNCELLDSVAKSHGLSLPDILGEIQGNIIDPVVDTQSKTAAWEGGMLDFSPAGAQGGVKVTLWGGASWGTVPVRGEFFGSAYRSTYINGSLRVGSSMEFPVTKDLETVVNANFWSGPTDFGTSVLDVSSRETDMRFGLGTRYFIFRNPWSSFYVGSGVVLGRKDLSVTFSGTSININSPYGRVGWRGEETYEEKLTYISFPSSVGTSLTFRSLTVSLVGYLNLISQTGTSKVSKWGPVGPFFGVSGFYNIGVSSTSDIGSTGLWPIARVSAEWNIFSDMSLMGNWNPKMGRYPQHAGIGVGWRFLNSPIDLDQRELSF